MAKPNLDQTEKNRLAPTETLNRGIATEPEATSSLAFQKKILEPPRAEPVAPRSEEAPASQPPETPAPAVTLAEPIPARMLNEFVYCQRLFYYEYVEGIFVESADTLRGGALHQRVDSGSGAMPKAKRKPEAAKARAGERAAEVETTDKSVEAPSGEPAMIHSRWLA